MKLLFYILVKGRRSLRFETAGALDLYVRTNKLPKNSIIRFTEDKRIVGEMKVSRYLQIDAEVRHGN